MANPINGNTGATYTRTADSVVANVFSPGTCSNTYCHSNGTGGTTQTGDTRAIVANTSPIWGGTATCYSCHGTSADVDGRPQYASGTPKKNSHTTASTHNAKACTVCHDSVTGTPGAYTPVAATHNNGSYNVVASLGYTYSLDGGTCSTVSCHGVAVWGVTTFDCVSCHTSPVTITNGPLANGTNQRRAVTTELTTSGSRNHKGTAISVAPTKWDCIVCHLEGNNDATGSLNATYHGNGVLDFRDPDGTGNQPIKKVSWGGLPYAANLSDAGGRYKDTLTNFTTARFSRDLSVVLESDPAWLKVASIQMNLCLHCHDNDGAKNSTAWTKNAAGTVVGTAYQPFGLAVGNSSAQYWVTTTLKSAAGNTTGNVMNVFSQLSSANASSHPVTGRGNNGYSRGTNMKAPWSGGTNTAKSSSTVYGYLISCFDCHGVKGSTGVQSATVVAHGNGSTINIVALRSPYPTAALGGVAISGGATNLCTLCHADTYVSGTTAHPDGMSPAGGNAGAFEAMSATTFGTCANCHVTYTDSVSARAVAVHGYNATEAGSATFPTTLSRPYAFWRGGPQVTYWGPGSCSVGGPGGSCTTQSYTTAGVY
jgi:predicted CxxxxCH...CXXCH cytochrome family protein